MKKLRAFLDKEFEIKLPKIGAKKQQKVHYVKERPGYVNPFKHQRDLLEQQRLKELKEKQQRLQAAALKAAAQAAKHSPVKHTQPVTPVSKPAQQPQTTPVPSQQHHSRPTPSVEHKQSTLEISADKAPVEKKAARSVLDKKIEFNIPKITLPRIKFKKPTIKTPVIKSLPKLQVAHYKKHLIVIGFVLAGVAALGIYSARQPEKPPAPKQVESITTANEQQVDPKTQVVEAVAKRITLPTDEDPVLATVTDSEKVKTQEFFEDAQNGDKILMYRTNKKAFLYRPSTDEVLAQAPLVYQDEPEQTAAAVSNDQTSADATVNETSSSGTSSEYLKHGKPLIEPKE